MMVLNSSYSGYLQNTACTRPKQSGMRHPASIHPRNSFELPQCFKGRDKICDSVDRITDNATLKDFLSSGGLKRGRRAHCLIILTDPHIRFDIVRIRGQRTNDHPETFEGFAELIYISMVKQKSWILLVW